MNRKNNMGVPERIDETNADRTNDLNYTLSEGSTLVFNADVFIGEDDVHNTKSLSFSCEQIDGIPVENLHKETDRMFSFRAPYLKRSDELHTVLQFRLTFNDDVSGGKLITRYAKVVVKRVQRAIIFQAGVALGAYEAGVFQALVQEISKVHREAGLENKRPLFDIVAGASIGAMNAAIVVTDAIKTKSWEHSAEQLVEFWRYQKYPSVTVADALDMNPMYHWWWDIMHITNQVSKSSASAVIEFISKVNPYLKNWYDLVMSSFSLDPDLWNDYFIDGWYIPASGESARRYYSAWQCKHGGAPHVASGIPSMPWSAFGKFFDFSDQSDFFMPRNFLPRPDNKHILA